jgi:hypothetical protein
MIGIVSRREFEHATYSASVVDNAIYVWSLDDHKMGHPEYIMM